MENPYKHEAGPAPVTPEEKRIADYRVAIGPNADYYLPRFETFDQGGSRLRWNWPAFFVTSPWFMYRKMWLPDILNLVYPFLLCFVAGIASAFLIDSIKAHPVAFAALFLVLLAVPWFLLPMFANAIYWHHIRGLIERLPRSLEQAPDKRAARLERNGGTGVGALVAVFGGIAVVLVGFAGILAAIAIPAYQDYTIRAQITEGLNLASGAKAAVAEYYAQNESWPEDSASAGLDAISGKYVESLSVQKGSVVIVYGLASNKLIAGKTLILLPGLSEAEDIIWGCANVEPAGIVKYADGPYGSDVPNKYLPSACRGEPRTLNQ
jgi:type IV pilus assembly protein PilA